MADTLRSHSTLYDLIQLMAISSDAAVLIAEQGTPGQADSWIITFANDAFGSLTGYTPSHAIGQSISVLTQWSQTPSQLDDVWRAITHQQSISVPWHYRAHNGEAYTASLSLTWLAGDRGTNHGIYAITLEQAAQTRESDSVKPRGAWTTADVELFLNQAERPLLLLDCTGNFLAANQAGRDECGRIFGCPPVVDGPFQALQPDSAATLDVAAFSTHFHAAIAGHPEEMAIAVHLPSGESAWYSFGFTPMQRDDGGLPPVLVEMKDITDVKQTEEELALAVQRYRLGTQHANSGVWDWNMVTGDFTLDPYAKALIGYSDEEIPNDLDVWSQFVYPDDREAVFDAVQACIDGKTDEYRVEHRMVHKDGSIRWILAVGKAVRDDSGQVLRLMGTDIDITHRRRIERDLQTSRDQFSAVWDVSPDAMVVCDSHGIIKMANPAFLSLVGLDGNNVDGQTLDSFLADASRAATIEHIRGVYAEENAAEPITSEMQTARGQRKIVEMSAILLPHHGGSKKLLAVMRDITERNAVEQALRTHARFMESLTRCSSALLRPASSDQERLNNLREALAALREGANGAVVAVCQVQPSAMFLGRQLCIEVCANENTYRVPTPSLRVLRELHRGAWISASAAELDEGHHAGPPFTYHFGPLTDGSDLLGYVVFGREVTAWPWSRDVEWFAQTATEMLQSVLQRWKVQQQLRGARADLERQVGQRTAMLFHTVTSLQRQVAERHQVEVEVRRRLHIEQTLSRISTRLVTAHQVGESSFDAAVASTLDDIGEQISARYIGFWETDTGDGTATLKHMWPTPNVSRRVVNQTVDMARLSRLFAHLEEHEFCFQVSGNESGKVESAFFRPGSCQSQLIIPLRVADELAGFLVCCDAGWFETQAASATEFVCTAATMLSGMLRIEKIMQTLEQRVAEQTLQLAAFFNMALLGSSSENLDETLTLTLSMVKEIGTCDAVAVHLVEHDGQALQLARQVGLGSIEHSHLHHIPENGVIQQMVRRTKTPILATKLDETPIDVRLPVFETYFGAPMVLRGEIQGLISCYWTSEHSVSLNQMSLLAALADQLGVVQENQRLLRQAQEMAVVNERQRLARELHDLVTQSLYSMMLFTRASREAIEDNDQSRLADSLQHVEEASLRSFREMRLLLYQLRPLDLEEHGLVKAILTRLALVERRIGIHVDLQMAPDLNLPRHIEDAIYAIVTEALNNSLKYANANQVKLVLEENDSQLLLCVQDNGVGFATGEVEQGMGLANMREHATAIQGDFELHSELDGGTRIGVRVATDTYVVGWS